jgi:hypothetical protein
VSRRKRGGGGRCVTGKARQARAPERAARTMGGAPVHARTFLWMGF